MPLLLTKTEFKLEHLGATQQLDCGEEPWAIEATQWIHGNGSDSVVQAHQQGAQIWLYGTDADGLVGFSSLVASRWRWKTPQDRAVLMSLIPMLGLDRRFRGQPSGPGERRFSDQIIDDLIFEAAAHRERDPLLGLYVDPRNVAAVKLYRRAGFKNFYKTYPNPAGPDYISMLLDLPR